MTAPLNLSSAAALCPSPLHRLPDWPERLAAYIAANRPLPFAWGTHDCALFAAGAVQAVTGCNVLPAAWADRASAAHLLRRLHGLVPAVDAALPRLVTPAWARRGDVVLVQQPVAQRGRARWLAVVDGAHWWAPSATGLHRGDMAQAVSAWGVGHA